MSRIPSDVSPGDPIRSAFINEVKAAILEDIVGDGEFIQTHRSGQQLVIRFGKRIPGFQRPDFSARVDDVTVDSQNKARYGYTEMDLNTDDSWSVKDGGHVGTIADGTYGVNGFDAPNSASGTQGNNVDIDNLNAGVTNQTIAIGSVPRWHWQRVKGATSDDPGGGWRACISNTYLPDGVCQ